MTGNNVETVLKTIKDEDIKFVDLRFTDPRGKLQHVTMDASLADEDMFADGVMFDGSSIAGWKAINESDMTLMPDVDAIHVDAFYAQVGSAKLLHDLPPRRVPSHRQRKGGSKQQGVCGESVFVGGGTGVVGTVHNLTCCVRFSLFADPSVGDFLECPRDRCI